MYARLLNPTIKEIAIGVQYFIFHYVLPSGFLSYYHLFSVEKKNRRKNELNPFRKVKNKVIFIQINENDTETQIFST